MSYIYNLIKKETDKAVNMSVQIENEINQLNIYEKYFQVDDGDIIVDIGAHIGLFSKKHLNKISKSYSIEPDPLFYKSLSELNDDKIQTFQKGIYLKDCKGSIKSDGNANTVNKEENGEIDLISFKTFIKENNIEKINFLKIDCEGAEYYIFNEENIEWLKENCDKIAGEFHVHNEEHKLRLINTLNLFDIYNLKYILTSTDGVVLTKKQTLDNLDYYTEILFYVLNNELKVKVNCNFSEGAYCEILSSFPGRYLVEFINNKNGEILHFNTINNNEWTKCYFEYFIEYKIKITSVSNNRVVYEYVYDCSNKKVFIVIESKSLGDTIAWFPYVEEFRKKHNCNIICSTFHNHLFKEKHPEITFIEPGFPSGNVYAKYNVGWYYKVDNENEIADLYKNPINPKTRPMQKTASDILGLEYVEIKANIVIPNKDEILVEPYVCIAMHSTSQAKYWNNPTGWQEVVDYLLSKGIKVYLVSKEGDGHMNNIHPKGIEHKTYENIEDLIWLIYHSKCFIGIGSGLTWLAWSLNIPTILISGFSEPYTEMKSCYRITSKEPVCTGCFNKFRLSPSDWNWCPVNKNTPQQFECSKTISSSQIIDVLEKDIFI